MKRIISVAVVISLFLSVPICVSAYSARAMCVMEASSKVSLYSFNADTRLPMASTTKIMTALVTLERADITKTVTVPDLAVGVEGSSMYLRKGQTLTIEQLLYGLMLNSGNDAATALAILVGGSVEKFCVLMNDKARSLGLENTNFTNPSGLPDPDHYTTAAELAKLTCYALSNEAFAKIVSTKTYTVGKNTYTNHNKLLSKYEYAIGVKTGFTKKAGRCLVSAAKKDDVTLVCVTLNAPDDWDDHIAAYENNFTRTSYECLAEKGSVTLAFSTPSGQTVYVKNRDALYGIVIDNKPIKMTIKAEPFVYAPKSTGDSVGSLCFELNGEVISTDLCLTQDIPEPQPKKQLFITRIIKNIKRIFKWTSK